MTREEIRAEVERYSGGELNLGINHLYRFLDELRDINGDVVEFGVYKGKTLAAMALWMKMRGMI